MKLLFYSHSFAPQIGGVETYSMLLARGLSLRSGAGRVEVTLATNALANGFDDLALPFSVVRRPGIALLAKLIRRSDAISLAGPALAPLLLCALLRKPVFVEHHGYQVICPNGLLLHEPDKSVCPGHFMRSEYGTCLKCNAAVVGWSKSLTMLLLAWPRRWLCRKANVNLCITEHVKRRLCLPRSTVVYYGIPDQKLSSEGGGIPEFAYVGRFVSEKGLPILVDAANILDKDGLRFRLLMIGDGPERGALEQQAAQLGQRHCIQFTGFLRGKDLDDAMARVSAVVMPSIWEETAGLSAMEHMMRGRPVVVADIGGLAEITGEGGLKFPPGDARALAQCLWDLANDPGSLADLGKRARIRARTLFSEERMVEEHRRVFEDFMSQA